MPYRMYNGTLIGSNGPFCYGYRTTDSQWHWKLRPIVPQKAPLGVHPLAFVTKVQHIRTRGASRFNQRQRGTWGNFKAERAMTTSYIAWYGMKILTSAPSSALRSARLGVPRISPDAEHVSKIAFIVSPRFAKCSSSVSESR